MLRFNVRNRKNESCSPNGMTYIVIDLQVLEECVSEKEAYVLAEDWMNIQRDMCRNADDDEIQQWLRSGDHGIDSGDVEIYEVPCDEADDLRDYYGHVSGVKVRNGYEPIEVFSGYEVIEDEAEKRHIRRW